MYTKEKRFYGHSYLAPTPCGHTFQRLGLAITKAYGLHLQECPSHTHSSHAICTLHLKQKRDTTPCNYPKEQSTARTKHTWQEAYYRTLSCCCFKIFQVSQLTQLFCQTPSVPYCGAHLSAASPSFLSNLETTWWGHRMLWLLSTPSM